MHMWCQILVSLWFGMKYLPHPGSKALHHCTFPRALIIHPSNHPIYTTSCVSSLHYPPTSKKKKIHATFGTSMCFLAYDIFGKICFFIKIKKFFFLIKIFMFRLYFIFVDNNPNWCREYYLWMQNYIKVSIFKWYKNCNIYNILLKLEYIKKNW